MADGDKKDGDHDEKVEVDTNAIRKFKGFLSYYSGELTKKMTDLDGVVIVAGDDKYFKVATTVKQTVELRASTLKTSVTNLRNDIDQLSLNMDKIAALYDSADDDSKAESEGLMPLISGGKTVPGAGPPAGGGTAPPNTSGPPAT